MNVDYSTLNVDFSNVTTLDLESFFLGTGYSLALVFVYMMFTFLCFTAAPFLSKLLGKLMRKVWKRIMQKKKKQAEIDQDPADPK